MASVSDRPSPAWTTARLRRHFGGIPAERILLRPSPGAATEADLLRANGHQERRCELVDATLVEKAMGAKESLLAALLLHELVGFLKTHPLGVALAPDALLRLFPGLVRAPDVSFLSWETIGADEFPDTPIVDLVPDLAVEILSRSNTKREIARKIEEYFSNGTREVWILRRNKQSVEVHTLSDEVRTVVAPDVLESKVLPGFALDLATFFTLPRRPRK
jgi:Uma2 family endonuclease